MRSNNNLLYNNTGPYESYFLSYICHALICLPLNEGLKQYELKKINENSIHINNSVNLINIIRY